MGDGQLLQPAESKLVIKRTEHPRVVLSSADITVSSFLTSNGNVDLTLPRSRAIHPLSFA
jgi:hypothetical protein